MAGDRLVFEAKCWGRVMHAFGNKNAAISYLEVIAGARSSWHVHHVRANHFVVISGVLIIECKHRDGGLTRSRVGHGEAYTVPPGIEHRFRVFESGKVIEVYWPEMPDAEHDIVRSDEGGEDDEVFHLDCDHS